MVLHRTRPAFSLFSYGLISLLIVLSYWPTLSGDFILDDIPLIQNNPLIARNPSVWEYLSQEDGGMKDAHGGIWHSGYYRPIINLTYWADYHLWGLRASGFRTSNLVLHILNCFILFSLIVLLLGDRRKALLIALIFSVHPIHTEAVSWVSSRNNILVSIFCLSSFYCYIQSLKNGRSLLVLPSSLLFAAGLLSKEFALMMIPLVLLYSRTLAERRPSFRAELIGYSPFVLVILVYFYLRIYAIGSLIPPSGGSPIWERIYFSPYIVMMNLRAVLFPLGLHSFILGYPGSFFDWRPLAGIACLGVYGWFVWRRRENKWFVFGAISFLIALFPVLNIVKTSAVTLISMRWLYFPSGFLLLGLFCTLETLLTRRRTLGILIAGCLTLYLGVYTYVLNRELWHSEDTFFRQEAIHFENAFYFGGFAENLSKKGRFRDAEFYFKRGIDARPGEAQNYINYAGLLLDTTRHSDALACLTRAEGLYMTPEERGQFYNNLGMAFFGLQKEDDALKSFKKAIVLAPQEPLFWANLGAAYGSMEEYENSVATLEKGIKVVSNSVPLKKNLAVSYIRIKEFEKAIAILDSIPLQGKEDAEAISTLLSQAHAGISLRRKNETAQEEDEGVFREGSPLKVR